MMNDDELSSKNSGHDTNRRSSRSSRNRLSSTLKDQSSVHTPVVLSADYLARHSSNSDLVKRLRKVVEALSDDGVEVDSPEYPGLARLASDLVKERYLKNKDKDVRLYTVLATMEIFRIYVPEPPYDENEVLRIFTQVIQQLANLSNCTSPKQTNFMQYLKLLQRLAHFKVGVVLVEMTKTLGLESEYDTDIAEDHHHYRSSRDSPSSEDTMEILRELIEVLLNNIQIEHPNEVKALAVSSICGCIEEFYNTVPIPILDEILTCVGRGPIIHVTNPEYVKATAALAAAKKRGKKVDKAKLPPPQLKQTNQSYMVACNVIKKTLDKISTPIASLLNGLLNGDTNITKYSNIGSTDEQPDAEKGTIIAAVGCMIEKEEQIADVWNIVYELHKVSPQILTTVIGTVASSLESPDDKKRFQVTKLLGRLFYSKSSDIGAKFFLCFKDWIKRSMDSNEEIRMMMIRSIIEILRNKGKETNLCEEATYALVKIATSEPSNDVRIKCIHKICDFIYYAEDSESTISTQLLQAVGNRISSKHKKERISALGGLAKIYYRQYMSKILKHAQEGGDDCSIGIILDTIHNNCDLQTYTTGKQTRKGKKKKSTSPKRSTIRYNDNNLDEKYKFISDKIFDSAFFTDKLDPMMRSSVYQVVDTIILGGYEGETSERNTKGKSLTNTSRAIGLAIIMNHLSTSHKDAIDQGESGTSLMWMCSLLAKRAQLQQALNAYITCKVESEKYPSGSEERSSTNIEAFEKLKIVASLSAPVAANPSGGNSEQLDRILTKVHNARDKHIFRLLASITSPSHSTKARSRAIDELPKRTKSLGTSAVNWIKSLVRRCSMGSFINLDTVTHCILIAQESLHERDFQVCMSFLECVKVAVNIFPTLGASEEGYETLVELFGECRGMKGVEAKEVKEVGILTTLSAILAVVTPSRKSSQKKDDETESTVQDQDFKSELYKLCINDGTPEQAKHAVLTMAALINKEVGDNITEQRKTFSPLLKALTAPSRMCMTIDGEENEMLVNDLATFTALVESVPGLFMSKSKSDRGNKAIRFTLDTILLGKTKDDASEESPNNNNDEIDISVSSRRISKRQKESTKLSTLCRQIVAAIEFLISFIRSTIIYSKTVCRAPQKEDFALPTRDKISSVFEVLIDLIKGEGFPSYSHNLQQRFSIHERATLRKCASVSLLWLCDGSLNLENKFLPPKYWHTLSKAFTDEDFLVRDTVLYELSAMLTGEGKFRQGSCGFLPSLRFLACITLCPDIDQHGPCDSAKVGKRALLAKEAATKCIISLRRTSEDTLLQCRAISKKAEDNFERNLKMKLMPEFAVPYAFHLLSFRTESPSGGASKNKSFEIDTHEELNKTQSAFKLLRKRLRFLLEPLVSSLGDGADNISFLLRLTELLGQRYRPIDVVQSSEVATSMSPFSDISFGGNENDDNDDETSRAKLKVICAEAREILLKFVKKDNNLTPYPGTIQIPSILYARAKKSRGSGEISKASVVSNDNVSKNLTTPNSSNKKSRIGRKSTEKSALNEVSNMPLDISPIPQSRSPNQTLKVLDTADTNHTMTTPESDFSFTPDKKIDEKERENKSGTVRRSARLSRD